MKMRYIFLLLFFWMIAYPSSGQNRFFKQYGTSQGLPGTSVYCMMYDQEGILWVGTNKGLAYFSASRFRVPRQTPQLSKSTIRFLLQTADGKIWAGTSDGNFYSGTETEAFSQITLPKAFQQKIESRILNSVYLGQNQAIYAGTVIGGELLQINSESVESPVPLDFSFYILEVEQGFVWGSNGGFPPNNLLYVKNKNEEENTIQLSSKSGFSKSCFLPLKNETKLFAKDYEIIQLGDQGVLQRSFLPQKIECVYETADEKIWVGLNRGGVICFLTESMTTDISSRYLNNQTVLCMSESKGGNMWFGTLESGLFLLPGEPELTYSPPRLLASTGMVTAEKAVSDSSQERDKTTRKEVTINAIIPSEPEMVFRDSIFPVVYISKVTINEKDTGIQAVYSLRHNQNLIKLHFAGLYNNNPQPLQYKYQLKGLDSDWIYSDVPYAQYSQLLPGEYNLVVQAMNKDGVWSKSPASMTFIIRQPFWNTAVFYGLVVILFLLVIVFALYFGLQRSRRKASENKQALLSELKVLRAQMNPHFTFNTLSSIQHFIGNNNNDAAIDYLSKFGKLLRSIMENTKKTAIPIQDELDALRLYLDLEKLRLNDKFDYEIEVGEEIDAQYDEIPSLLIQPYVENSIWHGFSTLKSKGKIKIVIFKRDKYIICRIQDNGIGREEAKRINGKKRDHHSMGMEITKERLEIINALKNSSLSVKIEDLTDEEGQAKGTCVEIYVPFEED